MKWEKIQVGKSHHEILRKNSGGVPTVPAQHELSGTSWNASDFPWNASDFPCAPRQRARRVAPVAARRFQGRSARP